MYAHLGVLMNFEPWKNVDLILDSAFLLLMFIAKVKFVQHNKPLSLIYKHTSLKTMAVLSHAS